MTTKSKLSVLLATLALSSAIASAQDATKDAGSPVTFDADVKWVNEYWSRGYKLMEEPLIIQPQATVGYKAYTSDDLSITPYLNLWANFTDDRYEDMDYFDELDITGGVAVTTGRVTFDTAYVIYTSPASNWHDIHEFVETISFDDAGLTPLPIALNPYVSIALETMDQGGEVNSYGEVGIKPKWTPVQDLPLTLQFPIALGIGFNNQYTDEEGNNENLGFYSAGVVATYNLTDNWYVGAGVKWIHTLADSATA